MEHTAFYVLRVSDGGFNDSVTARPSSQNDWRETGGFFSSFLIGFYVTWNSVRVAYVLCTRERRETFERPLENGICMWFRTQRREKSKTILLIQKPNLYRFQRFHVDLSIDCFSIIIRFWAEQRNWFYNDVCTKILSERVFRFLGCRYLIVSAVPNRAGYFAMIVFWFFQYAFPRKRQKKLRIIKKKIAILWKSIIAVLFLRKMSNSYGFKISTYSSNMPYYIRKKTYFFFQKFFFSILEYL